MINNDVIVYLMKYMQ